MRLPDYYAMLAVSPLASAEEVRSAYRHHACPGEEATRRFAGIAEAYKVLHDRDRRRAYDALRAGHRAIQRAA